jgi:uncharacterized protein
VNLDPALEEERFIVFDCAGSRCIGVLSGAMRTGASPAIGVVIVVGGPQYRVGSHRQFALLARALARAGIPALRFDYRGMGDSEGEPRTFDTIDTDIAAAVDALCREVGPTRVVLWGLCDGASAAFMYARIDPRVAGVAALNPWARSVQGEASTRLKHYYLQRLCSADFWRKVLSGQFDPRGAAGDLATTVRNASNDNTGTSSVPYLRRMEEGWRRFRRPALIVLSGNDLTAREFEAWVASDGRRKALLEDPLTEVVKFPDADHTFSDRASRDAVATTTIEWIMRLRPRH